jgi:hypothetical protein
VLVSLVVADVQCAARLDTELGKRRQEAVRRGLPGRMDDDAEEGR